MPKLAIHLVAPALLTAALLLPSTAKPCAPSSGSLSDTVRAKANVALGIAGTRRVAVDPSGSCLQIEVSTRGTARLVALLLRSLDVPRGAVRLHIVS
ncbi:MAG: hypothetical protein H0T68_04680 [Gemmatimonadales bacterium]|nr:hypothetical protein [Gemmatimonadales bacterium]